MRARLFRALSLLLGLFLVEAGARTLVHLTGREPPIPNLGRFDEALGWSLQPDVVGSSRRTGYKIQYRHNSLGIRDDETSYDKADGAFRIVLLGDSRTYGFGVPIEKHFSRLLEGYFPDVEVINLGVSGFGVDQELLLLRNEGFRYEPDLVIAYVAHYSDHRHLHATRWGKAKPRFVLDDAGAPRLAENPGARPLWARPGFVRRTHRGLKRHSATYGLVIGALRRNLPRQQAPSSDAETDEDDAFVKELHALGEALVAAMRDESVSRGAEFVLVTQIPELHDGISARGGRSLLIGAALNNSAFDLPDGLEHINEAGNGVLAWEIARYLVAETLVPTPLGPTESAGERGDHNPAGWPIFAREP